MSQEFDFNEEFTTDEELEAMFDAFVEEMGPEVVEEDSKTQIINPDKIRPLLYTYKLLKRLAMETDAQVTYALHNPLKSMGSVTICGKNLVFRNAEWFMKAVELSSNLEVYPRMDGTVEMNFTFHGLTKNFE